MKGIGLGVDGEKWFGVVVELPIDKEVCQCTVSSGYGEMVPSSQCWGRFAVPVVVNVERRIVH